MVIEPPAAIPGHFVPLSGLEPLVASERAETMQRQEQAAQNALDSALAALGGGPTIERQPSALRDYPAQLVERSRVEDVGRLEPAAARLVDAEAQEVKVGAGYGAGGDRHRDVFLLR
jgi:hypothetical protein